MPISHERSTRVTMGWELEAIRNALHTPSGVERARDGSVNGDGAEYRTTRQLIDQPQANVNALYALASDRSLDVDTSCGFHVHTGLPEVSRGAKRQWALFFYELGRRVENDAFRAVPESRRNNTYCRRLLPGANCVGYYDQIPPPNRYQWINISNLFIDGEIETVEIRLLGSTRRPSYLVGWLAACVAMANSAFRLVYDPTRLDRETAYMRDVFQTVQHGLMRALDTTHQWDTVERLLRLSGLPMPSNRRAEPVPATLQHTAGSDINMNPIPVRRARRARVTPLPPIEVTDELIRQATTRFTIARVA